MSEVKGDFEVAIHSLIHKLTRAENGFYSEDVSLQSFAEEILSEWDKDRGEDWFNSTIKRGEKK